MDARILAVLVVAAALAGCSSPSERPEDGEGVARDIRLVPAPVTDEERGPDEYWMVWVRGNQTVERENPYACARQSPSYEIHHANASVEYREESYSFRPGDVRVLIAYRHEDRSSSCPEVYRLVVNPAAPHREEMGVYGRFDLTVRPNGTLVADGRSVPLGQAARVTYEGHPPDRNAVYGFGSFRVVNLGAWAQGDLWAGHPHR